MRMIEILIWIIGIVAGWLLIHRVIRDNEEKKKVEHLKNIWKEKNYLKFIQEVTTRGELKQIVSEEAFLAAGMEMSVESFLTALVQYRFIESSYSEYTFGRYEYQEISTYHSANKRIIHCREGVTQILTNLLNLAVSRNDADDVLLLYFALYSINSGEREIIELDAAEKYVQFAGLCIYDSIVAVQHQKWNAIIKIEYNSEKQDFYEAERNLFGIEGILNKDDFLETNKAAMGSFDEVYINGHTLRFYSGPHIYFVDGIRVLSVTQILKKVDYTYGNYSGVSRAVLNRAAAKGTALHAEIQEYEERGIRGTTQEFNNYLRLKQKNGFFVKSCEQYVIIFYHNIPIGAGRFDLLLNTEEGKTALADIKRTSSYKKDDVTKQINLYRLGYIQTYGTQIEETYCIRLREEVAQFRSVDVDEMLANELVERYVNWIQKYAKSYFEMLQKK